MTAARAGAVRTAAEAPLAPEGRRLLLALLGAPVAWTLHLLGGYVLIALWCAVGWPGMGLAIGVLTLVCAAGAVASGVLGWRLWRHGQRSLHSDAEPGRPEPWDARMGERGARTSFLAVLALFMAALFAFVIVLEGLPPIFTPDCPATTMP